MLKDLNNDKLEKMIKDAQDELKQRNETKEAKPESPFDQTKPEQGDMIVRSRRTPDGMHFMFNCNADVMQIEEHALRTVEGAMEHLKVENPMMLAMFSMKLVQKLQDIVGRNV